MITGGAGSIQVWLWVMVAMTAVAVFVVFGLVVLVLRVVFNDIEDWRRSRTFKVLLFAIPLLVGLGVWYRVDSNPLWVARADVEAGIDYFVNAEGAPEVVRVRVDHAPVFWETDRPQPESGLGCDSYPASSRGRITTRTDENWREHFKQVALDLEGDGWETFVPQDVMQTSSELARQGLTLSAFRDNKSLAISVDRSDADTTSFFLSANRSCRDDTVAAFNDS